MRPARTATVVTSGRGVVLAATMIACALAPAAARAAPWDVGGAIPPARTPPATLPDGSCTQSYADDAPRGGPALRFGVGPRLAGEAGAGQTTPPVAEDPAKRDAALQRLKGGRYLAVRLNRLFESDGDAGIRRFQAMARGYAKLGVEVELQVRYHPTDARNGDVAAWRTYVRKVVRAFGPMANVTGLQITNEVNITASPNTSDGFYARAVDALVQGVETAKAEAAHRGFRRLEVGFNYAWRFGDPGDADFWRAVGRTGGARLRAAVDYVGLDAYPATFVPQLAQVVDLGDSFLEAIAQVRECFMPKAGFTRATPLRIEETGYPTGPGRPDEAHQASALTVLVRTANAYRGTYHLTDFRWFGLRDNTSRGPDFQSFFGLLRDDYTPKPSFGAYRDLIARLGARRPSR